MECQTRPTGSCLVETVGVVSIWPRVDDGIVVFAYPEPARFIFV